MVALEKSLDEFGTRLDEAAETPTNERAVVQILGDAIRTVSGELAAIEYESSSPAGYIDLMVGEGDVAIEVKYHRTAPGGSTRPMTAQFGDLLNDARKLIESDASRRVLVLVTDEAGLTHLRNKGLLPVRSSSSVVITERKVKALAKTAQRHAVPQGEKWSTLSVRRLWFERLSFGFGVAWDVSPATGEN